MIRGGFAVPMQSSIFSLLLLYPNKNYVPLHSQTKMLHDDLKYVDVRNEIEVYTSWELEYCNFHQMFLNWIISVIIGANLTQFCTLVV